MMLSVLHADCGGFDSLTPYQFYLSSLMVKCLADNRVIRVRFSGEVPWWV